MSIKALDQILANRIEKGKKLLNTSITSLVAPGENNGGELLRLEITLEDETTKARNIIHAVGKKIPPSKRTQESFNIQVTFKAEILFYQKIVPALQEFQKENGVRDVINCFVEFYGGRINLNGGDVVDDDAVIVMENLFTSGFVNIDRHIGYNLEETRMLIKDLANLQSTVLALKLKKPDVFQNEIRPLCCNSMKPNPDNAYSKVILVIRDILLENDKVAPYVPKVMEIWNKYEGEPFEYKAREPFATLAHCDLWVNNAMIKYENGKPTKNIFIDFQLYSYRSPVFDLLNFLFTSVQTEVLQKEFETLIKLYHSEFISNLMRLGCEIEPFLFSKFEEELKIDAGFAVSWAIIFIPEVVFGPKRKLGQEVKKLDFKSEEYLDQYRSMMLQSRERLYFMIETLGRKGWLRT